MNFCSHKVYISKNKLAAINDEEVPDEPASSLMIIEEENKSPRSDASNQKRRHPAR